MDLNLTGKTALITGSYRGTGLIIAQIMLQEGAQVLVHGLNLEQAQQATASIGGGVPVSGDIATTLGCDTLWEQCAAYSIDILINNYGGADAGSWQTSQAEDWLASFAKNVLSAQQLISRALGPMRENGWGRIINIGTVGSTRPNNRMPAYYAAKGALANMTIGLAKEVAGSGIGVNIVSPAMILTPEVQAAYMEKGMREGWGETWEEVEPHVAKDIPIGRITRREEVANLVAYLCSPLADAVHGQNIRIDGGQLGVVD